MRGPFPKDDDGEEHGDHPDAGRIVITQRLTLRPPEIGDLQASAALWANPEVVRYIGGRPLGREDVWARLLRYIGHWSVLHYGFWVVSDRRTGGFLGELGFADFRRDLPAAFGGAPEAGWAFTPAAQGQGLASEALAGALAWAERRLPSERLVCMIHPDNAPSLRLAARHGFHGFLETTHKGAPAKLLERRRGAGEPRAG